MSGPAPPPPVDRDSWAEQLADRRDLHRQKSRAFRVAYAIAGVIVLVVGIVAIPLPGPGWAIVFVGLGMLALEFVWAERLAMIVLDGLQRFWEWWGDARAWQRGIAIIALFAIVLFALSFSASIIGSPEFVPKLW
ncbi:hypothetical protein DSM112329_01987 [Paraconexibacter sp. AEG42_29]|uniref:TIGR02611 family protein n=1 Tax=Paraconexibacter sp. AEG42_29 TaxID=2997339 RepID=A0AAU7ATY3_9ACTN